MLHAANEQDHNQLVHLMLELSTIAASDQRGSIYILDYPDLVIAARDVDATRRLFESRTVWPGTRHARLAIANALSGDVHEAYRHAVRADEWIYHFPSARFLRARYKPNRAACASLTSQLFLFASLLKTVQRTCNRLPARMEGLV